jgi:ribosomal protein S18 acetylase RimI-like enzyme
VIIEKATYKDLDTVCEIAKINDDPVGFAVFDTSFFGYSFITLVIVNPQYRRKGAARELIEYIEINCTTTKLFTSTNESNITMQKVCESLIHEPIKGGYIC